MTAAPTIVDARGTLCPVPIIRLARVAATLPAGSLVALLSDDPAAEHDVPAWCRLRGHELLDTTSLAEDAGPREGRLEDGSAPEVVRPAGAEPHAPNPSPGQALRHLIRLGTPG